MMSNFLPNSGVNSAFEETKVNQNNDDLIPFNQKQEFHERIGSNDA